MTAQVRTEVPEGPFEVRTEIFEGPFDLLLHLILRDEVDLYEVRVGDIVDAYLAELDGWSSSIWTWLPSSC